MISIFEWLDLPPAVRTLLFSLPIIFLLSLPFAGADFGVVKVPKIVSETNRYVIIIGSAIFLIAAIYASYPTIERRIENAPTVNALERRVRDLTLSNQDNLRTIAKIRKDNQAIANRENEAQRRYQSIRNQYRNLNTILEDIKYREERMLRLFDKLYNEEKADWSLEGENTQGTAECRANGGPGLKFLSSRMRCIPFSSERFRVVNAPIYDFSDLAEYNDLREINLTNTFARNIEFVSKFSRLWLISLDETFVSNLNPLAELYELREIYLNRAPVSDLRALSKLRQLEIVALRLTKVKDISPLGNSRGIVLLDLFGTDVEELEGIRGMEKLRTLNLSRSKVKSIDIVSTLVGLKSVSLEGTQIQDVSPLLDLPELRHVVFPDGSEAGSWNTGASADVAAVKEAILSWRPN